MSQRSALCWYLNFQWFNRPPYRPVAAGAIGASQTCKDKLAEEAGFETQQKHLSKKRCDELHEKGLIRGSLTTMIPL